MTRRRTVWIALLCAPFGATALAKEAQAPIALVVQAGKLVSGPSVIKLKRDDPVLLTIVSDAADELHVHGYNLHVKLLPQQTATLQFIAKRTGRFTFELHKAGTELGAFEVYPK